MTERLRLDLALEARGLSQSRARARDAILRGTVWVNGRRARKPHQPVAATDLVEINDLAAAYVSRAALKLIAALDAVPFDLAGKNCLDIGASTGGFTQVLLERGAAKVFAVDVGHGQLHETLGPDPRVVALEGTNARDLTNQTIADPIDLLTADLSFVSVTKVLASPLKLCRQKSFAIILIKPQFEAGPEYVGKGGIVSDPSAIEAAADRVIAFMSEQGFGLLAHLPSPILGGDGNQESLAVFRKS